MKSENREREEAFQHVYEDAFPILVRVVYRITGNMDAAEEICQEAFIRYYQRMDSIPDAQQGKYWLIRVSKNLALNHEKRKGRERRAYERAFHEPSPHMKSGEDHVLRGESVDTVQQALDTIPEKLRTVLILKEYGDLSYKEIGRVLGISEGNVKIRVFRAREKLMNNLNAGDVYVP